VTADGASAWSDTERRSLAHWDEAGRRHGGVLHPGLTVEDYRQMVAARDWATDLQARARSGEVRVLDVACGSGKFPSS